MSSNRSREFLAQMWRAIEGEPAILDHVQLVGAGHLASVFPVSDFAAAAVGVAAAALAELVGTRWGTVPPVSVDRRLASLWYGWSLRPDGWTVPPTWDPIAGDYQAADGWMRLHTNAPHHRDAALSVLGVDAIKADVARVVATWNASALETAIVARGGCAAEMRSIEAWRRHPQGTSLAGESLLATRRTEATRRSTWSPQRDRPLHGRKVLDLTRVLAGPVATRFLAGFGADVLRIDAPAWDEPAVVPEVTLGKRCARLDLRLPTDRARFEELLRHADVLVHGYRADALDALGLDAATRQAIRPGLVDVSLCAYGWTGPWRNRRGFDSLVQMSAGIADAGMRRLGTDRPTPLPVQALDHATGYLLAAAAIRGLTSRFTDDRGVEARASLARTAAVLIDGAGAIYPGDIAGVGDDDWSPHVEATAFGPGYRLRPPIALEGAAMRWDRPATRLGSAAAEW